MENPQINSDIVNTTKSNKQIKTPEYYLNAIKKYQANHKDEIKEYQKNYRLKKKAEINLDDTPNDKLTKAQLILKIEKLEAQLANLKK